MYRKANKLIPAKFLTLLAHLAIAVAVLWSSKESARACLPELHSEELLRSQSMQLALCISLTIGLIILELIVFLIGLTMFHSASALISVGCHGSACLVLGFLIFDGWTCSWYWIIFSLCSLPPILCDMTTVADIIINKKY